MNGRECKTARVGRVEATRVCNKVVKQIKARVKKFNSLVLSNSLSISISFSLFLLTLTLSLTLYLTLYLTLTLSLTLYLTLYLTLTLSLTLTQSPLLCILISTSHCLPVSFTLLSTQAWYPSLFHFFSLFSRLLNTVEETLDLCKALHDAGKTILYWIWNI